MIDFAAAKIDHVSVDLARLLGSLIPDDDARMAACVAAYESNRPLGQPELVPLLDQTGVVVAVINWLRRLYHDGEATADRSATTKRLGQLVERLGELAAAT